jgi:transposase
MLRFSVPPGYVRTRPPVRPKLDPFTGIIDQILAADKNRPKKQRHTSKRIFERLRDEHGFTGGITIVKDYIRGVRQRQREMFVPLAHPPGHAQVDFGEALGVIGGVERKIHFLAMSLPHSDACFVKAYPGETTEAFCDGHVAGVTFFGGVPRSILYDYVPRHIIVVLCRPWLCAPQPVDPSVVDDMGHIMIRGRRAIPEVLARSARLAFGEVPPKKWKAPDRLRAPLASS